MKLYYRKSIAPSLDPKFMREIFEAAQEGIKYYSAFFGTPFAYSKYDQVFVPEFGSGAMENVGCIIWTEQALKIGMTLTAAVKTDFQDTNMHELAHQWFGNLITMRWWDDLWLNESFATALSFASIA